MHSNRSSQVLRASPLGAVKRLINEPSVVLRVIDDRVLGIGIAKLINLSPFSRADGEPVFVGVLADLLTLVEVANRPITEDVTAEIDGNLFVQVDVFAVFVQALDTCRAGILGSIALRGVCSVR